MATNQVDLISLFNQVSKTVKKSKKSLNEADTYNHDHGDHMVDIFEVITQAMKEKKNADPADQLEYAAEILRRKEKSGSGQLYSKGLKEAAKQITGKNLDAGSIINMLQTIMGAGQAPPQPKQAPSGGMLGDLLGSLVSGGGNSGGTDLGDPIGAFTGGSSSNAQDGLGLDALLGAGMEMLSGSQGGKSNLEALTGVLVGNSEIAKSSPHREQSSQLVTQAMLKALGSMLTQ